MSVSLLKLSLNEVRFYFTRAAVGVGVPFGLAEDFGRSVSWLACSGLDPASICAPVLQSLESGQSSLYPKLNQWNGEALLKPPPDKLLSAIQAGSFASDWIVPMEQKSGKNSYLSAENVDYPFLVAAALGASGCSGWEISWETSSEDRFLINYEENRSWDAFWSDRVVPENSGPGRLKITPADIGEPDHNVWLHREHRSSEDAAVVLETGVAVHESWPVIYSFFKRCLVPSTDDSHQAGAGAGLVDSD